MTNSRPGLYYDNHHLHHHEIRQPAPGWGSPRLPAQWFATSHISLLEEGMGVCFISKTISFSLPIPLHLDAFCGSSALPLSRELVRFAGIFREYACEIALTRSLFSAQN